MGRYPKYTWPDSPMYYLGKYKTTQRPRVCVRSGHTAYYYHPTYDWLCSSCLLDLVNIGQMAFKWCEYEEVWNRCQRLLDRPLTGPRPYGIVKNVDVDMNNAALWEEPLDGYNHE